MIDVPWVDRRRALLALAAAPFLARAQQTYPGKPVRLIVPFVLGRVVAQKLGERWGQQVIVENKPGGSTVIGAMEAVRAPADGLTLFMPIDSTLTMNPALFSKLPYQPLTDLANITMLATQSLVVLTNDRIQAKSLAELIALAKAQPGQINYGSGTISTQLAGEMLNRAADIKLAYIPYKGSADVVKGMLSGEIQTSVDGIAPNVPHIRSGRFHALATTGLERSPALPEVPTLHELGLRNFEVRVWLGLSAPAATPVAIQKKILADSQAVMAMPDVREKLLALGLEAVGSSQEQFLETIRVETARYAPLIKELGIRLD